MERSDFVRVLEGLLSYTVADPARAANDLADKYKNYENLAVIEYDELAAIESLGEGGANLIRLAYAVTSRRVTDKFKLGRPHTEEEILAFLKGLFYSLPNETVYVLLLDEARRVTFCEFLGEGTVNASSFMPRKVLELAVKRGARYAILAHNHPAGYAKPSVEDVAVTEMLKGLFASSGRELIGHYIFSGNEYHSIDMGRTADGGAAPESK